LIRLALRCRAADAELVLAELLELAPSGIEEVGERAGGSGVVEYAIYGAPGELPDLGELQAAAGGALVDVRTEAVPDDWSERWRRFYHPLLIGGRLYVRPPWEQAAERGGVVEVVIDPGRAFGTGTHATTRMCLELLLAEAGPPSGVSRLLRALAARALRGEGEPRRSLCDLGTGSGVIAIAAAKLGFGPVLAVDVEEEAVEEADRNARANYVEVEIGRRDLRQGSSPRADVVTANLNAGLLEAVAGSWREAGTCPGAVIASGFLVEEADAVAGSLAETGLVERRRLVSGDWVALLARRQVLTANRA
jgi:ribosomal protein L11 methyltransferase